jgi:DNA-directed RNA polymerase specialized sigma subunit
MKVIHTELKNYNRRADESVSFKCDSLLQLSSKDIGEIDSYRGSIAILALTDSNIGNELDIDIDDILASLPENDLYDNHKTPSQRLRGVLWYNCQQKLNKEPTKQEFADYYKTEMEKIIQHYKDKLDNL